MYRIKFTKSFKKSIKRIKFSGGKKLIIEIEEVVENISNGKKLGIKYQDHKLNGTLQYYRECHVRPDLLLIYQIDKEQLILVDIGPHSYLFKG